MWRWVSGWPGWSGWGFWRCGPSLDNTVLLISTLIPIAYLMSRTEEALARVPYARFRTQQLGFRFFVWQGVFPNLDPDPLASEGNKSDLPQLQCHQCLDTKAGPSQLRSSATLKGQSGWRQFAFSVLPVPQVDRLAPDGAQVRGGLRVCC